MDDLRALASKLGEAIQDEPPSCCCVPYLQNLELFPGPSRPVPQIKAELRGGKHYPACSCIKRNGLQDSCLSWRCMMPLNRRGCGSLPFPTCALGRRQLARYAALPDRTPEYCRYDSPPCTGDNIDRRGPA